MSQQPDPTIPFDASVVDEEALRALRAVQRSLPMGDGGASGNLVGGTEAVAAFGMVRGGPSGGIAVRPHEIDPLYWNLAPAPQDEALKPLDLAPPANPAIKLDEAPSDLALSISAAPMPMIGPRANLARSSSSYIATDADESSAQVTSPVFANTPDDPVVATPPTTSKPDPQEPVDIVADPLVTEARDVAGLEDASIRLDLSAALVDRDGSEALTISILGVPPGAVLSHGTRQPDGSWSVPAADLAQLSLTPPEHFSGSIDLTLRATSLESQGGSTAVVETPFRVQVQAVADAPSVVVMDARGSEDAPVGLTGLGGALRDGDGSESLSFVLGGVPGDAALSAGTRQPDGTWKLTSGELAGLTLHPPAHFSGSYTLTLTAVATESSNGSRASTSASFTVGIDPVADAGTISGASTGQEDTAIVIRPSFATPDPSETWSEFAQVSGVPAGARLSHGTELSPGVWQVATADLQAGRVALHPAEHSDADFTLTVRATLIDTGNGTSVSREVTGTHAVTVTAVADAPQVIAKDVTGHEDTAIPLDLSAALTDTDGSELLSVSILNVPSGASLSHGMRQPDGSWSVPVADLAHLTFTPPQDFSSSIDLILRATAREGSNGNTATTDLPFQVRVTDVSDAPLLTTDNASGLEDTAIPLDLSATLTDTDKSEALSISIHGVPADASLSHGTRHADGSWLLERSDLDDLSLRPSEHYSGTINLTVEATSRSSNGSAATTRALMRVQVQAVADAPSVVVMDARGSEDTPVSLAGLGGALIDRDDSESLGFVLSGVSADATLSAGTRQSNGTWQLTHAELSGLTLKPPANFSGSYNLTLTAVATETSNGSEARSSASFTVGFDPVVDAAGISGSVSGLEDTPITLKPIFDVSDKDGSETWSEFSQVSGVPAGARLSHGSELSPGVWQVSTADLQAGLVLLHPAQHSDADFTLTIKATLTDTGNGRSASREVTGSHAVTVAAVADAPQVTSKDVTGQEDTGVPLDLSAALVDKDGSELLSVIVAGIPEGVRLSAGLDNADGSWTLSPAELMDLKLIPAEDFSGSYTLTVTAISTESSNGSEARSSTSFTIGIDPVLDHATIGGSTSGLEDTGIALKPAFILSDKDGSETWSEVSEVSGVPPGARLSHGSELSPGVWQVATADLQAGRVLLHPAQDSDADAKLTIRATLTDTGNSKTVSQEVTGTYTVSVTAVSDAPIVTVANAHGYEDMPVNLAGLGAALRDLDGSESLSFVLSGVPITASLSAGTKQADGSWKLTPAQLTGLTLNPPKNFSGSLSLKLTAVATEAADNHPTASTSAAFTVGIDPVLDKATISGSTSGLEDADITLKPSFALSDKDGSETWSTFTEVTGVPLGATLKGGSGTKEISPGVWQVNTNDLINKRVTIKPPLNSDDDFTLTFTVTQTDSGNGTSVNRTVTGTYGVTVNAVADAPTVMALDAKGNEDTAIALDLSAKLTDLDGSETLSIVILGIPDGAVLVPGMRQPDGSWSVKPSDLASLTFTPPRDFSGSIALSMKATSKETNGGAENSVNIPFKVQVDAVADAPELRVSPAYGDEDTAIPLHLTARTTDIDNSESIIAYRLEDVPEGAIVRAGGLVLARDADNGFTVPAGAVGSLTITPPPHSDEDMHLKVFAISAEPNGSTARSVPKELVVTVRADADAPILDVKSASGSEDSDIPLNLTATLPDNDGSETLSFVISGIPNGALLSVGTYRGPGTWSLTADEARIVTLRPPADFAGTINLTVTAVTQEKDGGDQASTRITFPVHVGAVVDAPAVGGLDGSSAHWGTMHGTEDEPIKLNLDPGLRDRDGSEKVVGDIVIGGIPSDAVLRLADNSIVTADPDGFYRIAAENMAGVTLMMPHNSDVAETLTVRMTIQDMGGSRTVTKEISGHMMVDPRGDADDPAVITEPSTGPGHNSTSDSTGWITLSIAALPTDTDGSESLTIWVRGVPKGASLSHGIPAGEGVWLVPVADLPSLAIRPKAGDNSAIELNVWVVVTEREGDQAIRTESVSVTVTPPPGGGDPGGGSDGDPGGVPAMAPVAQAPELIVSSAPTLEDNRVALSISAKTLDTDNGSETLGIRIDHVPEGARLSAGVRDPKTGSWVLRADQLAGLELIPPANFAGTISLKITAISTEKTGSEAESPATLNITLEAVADGASISAAPPAGAEDVEIPLELKIGLRDGDGSEIVTSVMISKLETGARIEGAGVTDNRDGTWSVDPAHLDSVRVIPPANWIGDLKLTVTATTKEASNGDTRTTSQNVSIRIEAIADAPTLKVTDASGREDATVPLNVSAALVDADGSEVLSVVIGNLPEGARLSAGLNNGDGTWTLTPGQLMNLSLIPPANWSGTANLSVLAHARETSNGKVDTTEATLKVEVEAVADAPVVGSRDVVGLEDGGIRLDLSAGLVDRDGSEALTVLILGVPEGAVLSHGTRQPDGSWSVPATDLAQLSLTPPEHFSGPIALTLRATAQESSTGQTAMVETTFRVQVQAAADAPSVTVMDARGAEDAPVSLAGLSGALIDRDGSEALSFVLSGVPADASLSAGTRQPDGTWKLTSGELAGLTLTPPAHVSGSYSLTLTAIATESSNGSQARTLASFTVGFDPVADAGTISGASTGAEDTAIVIQPSFGLGDRDGSETWSALVQVSGVPAGARLSHGTELSPGVWQVSTADLQAGRVALHPAQDSDADFTLTVRATLIDTGNGTSVSREVTGTHAVTVTAVADAPQVTAKDVTGQEDTPAALDISASLTDADGSEVLSVMIGNLPQGARLSAGLDNGNGTWTLTPAQLTDLTLLPGPEWSGTATLSVQAHARETSNGKVATSEATLKVEVEAVADAPRVEAKNVTGQEDIAIPLDLSATLIDTDGSEAIVVGILGLPEGFTLSAGTMGDGGEWRVPAADLQSLKLTPPADWNGTLNLTVQATSTEASSVDSATSSKPFTVTIDPVNDAPELALTAAEYAEAGARQVEAVGAAQVEDIDSAKLGGAVVTLSGAQPGDKLDLEGFTLHSENGHTMIGDTGIELVGGAYAGETGTLTLSGHASPETYAAVLQSLMLESGDQSGLTAGTRSIGVVLFDSEGAASTRQSVDVVVDEVEPVAPQGQGFETAQNGTGADIILLMADEEADMSHAATVAWTEQIDGDPSSTTSDSAAAFDQPTANSIQAIDDLQVDASRMHWS
ncbi:Ig-like domain-containing protein [Microvirga sp. CF3062]|uniref:Ig-like domain-containing protein n=1 Tax=Microvirga sp. CF3062 TaxID=3110182 RepID=UPI002E75A6E4|nr:Ig-like domain-containing protein [Microvirga sp. CF3062]MEE1656177.1 Ig-like domain-containing protein [Microvirga sp. CF3062]